MHVPVLRFMALVATLSTLLATPTWAGGWLGITVQPPEGVQIGEIVKDGPADKAGLQKNDILTKMDDKKITAISQFLTSIAAAPPGKEMVLTIVRKGDERQIKIIPDDSMEHQSLIPDGRQFGTQDKSQEKTWQRSVPWQGNAMPPMEPNQMEPNQPYGQPNPMEPNQIGPNQPYGQPNPMYATPTVPLEPDEPPPAAWLGVAPELTQTGVVITRIAAGGPGEKSGLKINDIIVSLNGQSISSPRAMSRILRGFQPGDLIEVTINRGGQMIDVQAQLIAPPVEMP